MSDADDTTFESIKGTLERFQQTHLLQFHDELSRSERAALLKQIASIDFELVDRLWRGSTSECEAELGAIEPPVTCAWERDRRELIEAGEAALRSGTVAVLLVAGGQGTRLGFPHPKGLFPLGPISGRTLFQILVDKIRAIRKRYGVRMPLWILTSRATDAATREYFARHDHLGLTPDDVFFFKQGSMPAVDAATGKILLEDRGHVALSPNGHGGVLAALHDSGGLDEAANRGITTYFYGQVDNPLLPIGDPAIIGRHAIERSDATSLAVAKRSPDERVGVFVRRAGKLQVIEYSDLPRDLAQATDADGGLRFGAGSIAVHLFDRRFLERQADIAESLPYHRARKKTPFVDPNGRRVEPDAPNAIKFERFIFDLLPRAERPLVIDVPREETFAPVKNADGAEADTPSTARDAMVRQAARWLASAGARVSGEARVEIDPVWADSPEEVARKLDPETIITTDTYLTTS